MYKYNGAVGIIVKGGEEKEKLSRVSRLLTFWTHAW